MTCKICGDRIFLDTMGWFHDNYPKKNDHEAEPLVVMPGIEEP